MLCVGCGSCVAESMTPGRHALRHLVSRCNGGADAGTDAPVSKRGVLRVCNGWQRVVQSKVTSSMLSEIKSTPPPQSQTETRPAGGLRRHEPPRRPSSLPGESGQWRRGVQIQPSSPDPTRSEFPLPPFCSLLGFPATLQNWHVIGTPPVWTLDISLESRHGPSRVGQRLSLIRSRDRHATLWDEE